MEREVIREQVGGEESDGGTEEKHWKRSEESEEEKEEKEIER